MINSDFFIRKIKKYILKKKNFFFFLMNLSHYFKEIILRDICIRHLYI